MKRATLITLLAFCVLQVSAYTERNFLQKQAADAQQLKQMLVMNQEWVTYPDYADRTAWDSLFGDLKEKFIRRGEAQLDYSWKVVKATDYLAFERNGNRNIMEAPFDSNNYVIADLLLAELAEGKGRFIDQLANGVFHSCEMTSWALSAHIIAQPSRRSLPAYDYPVIDLASGDLSSLLAWTHYFLRESFDRIDPEISRRLRHEIKTRTLEPYLNNNSFWWMGRNYHGQMLNNWTPWCTSNALMCFMLMENDRDTLAKAVHLTMDSMDKFLNYIKADGGCEEGPSYWGHAAGKTLDYLDLLSMITDGKINIFHEPMVRNMGEYISRSYVGNGWVVNFADASARGGGDASLIYRFGKAVDSDELKGFAAQMRTPDVLPHRGRDMFRTLASIAVHKELQQVTPMHKSQPLTWYPETEFCYLSTDKGLFLATKGGYNDESHNHNDVGSCSVWLGQMPVLIDAGVGTYTKQTFSNKRYSIWTMQSNYHNLPMINGVPQKNGKKYKASDIQVGKNSFSVDISKAYPAEAKVNRWVRSYQVKGTQAQIKDAFELKELSAPNVINFMTWGDIDVSESGKVYIQVNDVKAVLTYDDKRFELAVETKSLGDPRLSNVWGTQIYRLSFTNKKQALKDSYSFTLKRI